MKNLTIPNALFISLLITTSITACSGGGGGGSSDGVTSTTGGTTADRSDDSDSATPDPGTPGSDTTNPNNPGSGEPTQTECGGQVIYTVGASQGDIIPASGQTLTLSSNNNDWGQLHFSSTQLPQNLTNARETFQSSRYNGRTGWENQKDDIFIPMRSHWAHCVSQDNQGNNVDNLFVSMTLQDGDGIEDNVGSVFHMQYDSASQSYLRTGNEITLNGMCHQAHGIAANADCSRVALLCETEPEKELDPCFSATKDLVAESDDVHLKQSNNYQGNANFLRDLPNALVNFERFDFREPTYLEEIIPISTVLPTLNTHYPGVFNSDSVYKNLSSGHFSTLLAESPAFAGKMDEFRERFHIQRDVANDEIWLLEWNANAEPVNLDDKFDSFIVSKLAGGSGAKTAMNLLYTDVEDDDRGWGTYAFAQNTRYFADDGSSHVSGSLNVIKRDFEDNEGIWEYDLFGSGASGRSGRGWGKDCTIGHVLHARVAYDPFKQEYTAVCTTDHNYLGENVGYIPNSLFGPAGGSPYSQLGNIAIKDENSKATVGGRWVHVVQNTNSYESIGGGHTLVALDENTNMLAFVAGQPTSKSAFDGYIHDKENGTLPAEQAYGANCYTNTPSTPNCDNGYLDHLMSLTDESQTYNGVTPFFNIHDLKVSPEVGVDTGHTRSVAHYMRSVTRIGLLKTNGQEPIPDERVKWIGDEWDLNADGDITFDNKRLTDNDAQACSYSDPQLVNLGNGRLLLGYAKQFCYGEQYRDSNSYNTRLSRINGLDLLVPMSYYLAELDLDGNIVAGPTELKLDNGTTFGWGGLDEIVSMGDGKAAWLYIEQPTRDNPSTEAPDPLNHNWRVMVYESAHNQN
ncbi:hypothetical protein [Bacterioplanoides sp.]|uniref:hypothetical protein n=1 Tax=Bacterioplanoides sp. TaxID=2066072 RepID=UPI003B00AB39